MSTTVASVDYEYNAEQFWARFHTLVEQLPAGSLQGNCRQLIDRNTVTLSGEQAAELQEFCSSIPGYSGGPSHAPNALVFQRC